MFEISPSGNGQWTETDLYDFQGGSDGYQPPFGFGLAWSGGDLYGTSSLDGATNLTGTIFSLTPRGSSWQLNNRGNHLQPTHGAGGETEGSPRQWRGGEPEEPKCAAPQRRAKGYL